MVRPRGAGFCYTEIETEQMFADARILMEQGSDGLAFGFLTEDGRIHSEKTSRMIQLIHAYQGEAVFHRAFDCVAEPYEAIEELIRLGADRILTSGLKETAIPLVCLPAERIAGTLWQSDPAFWSEAVSIAELRRH